MSKSPKLTAEEKKAKWAAYMKAYRAKDIERNREIQRDCYYRNREARKARMAADRAKDPEKARREAARRHKLRMENRPEYAEAHRLRGRVVRAKRRAAEAADLALFFNEEIKRIYAECPKGYEVDHIYPLLGENFSGLHVPWNLQYLPVKDNRSKGNRLVA